MRRSLSQTGTLTRQPVVREQGTTVGASSLSGGAVTLSFDTKWGIDSGGVPYYNAAGVPAADAAVLLISETGALVIRKPVTSGSASVSDNLATETTARVAADAAHAALTTSVHGISDTSKVLTSLQVQPSIPRNGFWVGTPGLVTGTTSLPTLNRLVCTPIVLGRAVTISALSVNVSTAGAATCVLRLGLYADFIDTDGSHIPKTLLVDAGTIDATTTGQKSATTGLPTSLPAGIYWLGCAVQGTNASLGVKSVSGKVPLCSGGTDSSGNACGYLMDSVSGALPGTFSAPGINQIPGQVPSVLAQVTA